MTSYERSLIQFILPFDGLRDRIRNIAAAGNVVILPRALPAMRRANVNDVIMTRALKRCEMMDEARRGDTRGEWICVVGFNAKGFRRGGAVRLTLSKGRAFIQDIFWDQQP